MSNYEKYTLAQRKAWGKKMAAARAAKASDGKAVDTGRGAYKKSSAPVKKTSRKRDYITPSAMGIGGTIGTALGGPVGGAVGAGMGLLAGEAIRYFTGKGDYQVKNNVFLKEHDENSMIPIYNPHRGGGDVFRRCEYLGDIISSSSANTFKVQSFPVNPGLESTFEWLSQIAGNYEEYEFEGLYFEFRSMSGDALNSTNTALGQVIMAASYNAGAPNFTNKQQMENYEGGVSIKPSKHCRYFVECAKNQTVLSDLYIRQGAVPSGQDQRLYDLCNFQIATNGLQGTSVNLGELWVSFQVCLRKPKLFAALGLYNSFASISSSTGAYTNALPLGSTGSWSYSASNTLIGVNVSAGIHLQWSPPTLPQTYMVYIVWTGTQVNPVVAPTRTAITGGGMTIRTENFTSKTATDTATTCSYQGFWTYSPSAFTGVSGVYTGVTFGTGGTLPSAGSGISIYVMQVPNTLFDI